MKLIWNGHSCFTLATEAGTLVIDPYEDGSVPGLSPLHLEADAVYCSHEHRDHGNRAAVALSGKPCAVEVEELATWHDEVQGAKRGPNTMRIFSAEGLRVAHLGDLGCGLTPEQAEALSGLDALLIPVGGFYTIDAGQAKAVMDQLKPRVVVPMHYRGKDFGYEVIGPVEDFLALQSGVVRYEGNVLELTQDTPPRRRCSPIWAEPARTATFPLSARPGTLSFRDAPFLFPKCFTKFRPAFQVSFSFGCYPVPDL